MENGLLRSTGSERIKEYLLGRLNENHRADVELRLLNDDEFFDELQIIEDELVDDYLSGRLDRGDKRRFENHFLVAPERKARLQFGKVFNRYLELNEPSGDLVGTSSALVSSKRVSAGWFRPFTRPWVAATVSVAILLAALMTYWAVWRGRNNVDSTQRVVFVSLMPGAVRSAGAINRVDITPDVGLLQLGLGLAEVKFSRYSATILSEGQTVSVVEGLTPTSQEGRSYVVVALKPLAAGDYQVKLAGVSSTDHSEELDTYNFRVVAR